MPAGMMVWSGEKHPAVVVGTDEFGQAEQHPSSRPSPFYGRARPISRTQSESSETRHLRQSRGVPRPGHTVAEQAGWRSAPCATVLQRKFLPRVGSQPANNQEIRQGTACLPGERDRQLARSFSEDRATSRPFPPDGATISQRFPSDHCSPKGDLQLGSLSACPDSAAPNAGSSLFGADDQVTAEQLPLTHEGSLTHSGSSREVLPPKTTPAQQHPFPDGRALPAGKPKFSPWHHMALHSPCANLNFICVLPCVDALPPSLESATSACHYGFLPQTVSACPSQTPRGSLGGPLVGDPKGLGQLRPVAVLAIADAAHAIGDVRPVKPIAAIGLPERVPSGGAQKPARPQAAADHGMHWKLVAVAVDHPLASSPLFDADSWQGLGKEAREILAAALDWLSATAAQSFGSRTSIVRSIMKANRNAATRWILGEARIMQVVAQSHATWQLLELGQPPSSRPAEVPPPTRQQPIGPTAASLPQRPHPGEADAAWRVLERRIQDLDSKSGRYGDSLSGIPKTGSDSGRRVYAAVGTDSPSSEAGSDSCQRVYAAVGADSPSSEDVPEGGKREEKRRGEKAMFRHELAASAVYQEHAREEISLRREPERGAPLQVGMVLRPVTADRLHADRPSVAATALNEKGADPQLAGRPRSANQMHGRPVEAQVRQAPQAPQEVSRKAPDSGGSSARRPAIRALEAPAAGGPQAGSVCVEPGGAVMNRRLQEVELSFNVNIVEPQKMLSCNAELAEGREEKRGIRAEDLLAGLGIEGCRPGESPERLQEEAAQEGISPNVEAINVVASRALEDFEAKLDSIVRGCSPPVRSERDAPKPGVGRAGRGAGATTAPLEERQRPGRSAGLETAPAKLPPKPPSPCTFSPGTSRQGQGELGRPRHHSYLPPMGPLLSHSAARARFGRSRSEDGGVLATTEASQQLVERLLGQPKQGAAVTHIVRSSSDTAFSGRVVKDDSAVAWSPPEARPSAPAHGASPMRTSPQLGHRRSSSVVQPAGPRSFNSDPSMPRSGLPRRRAPSISDIPVANPRVAPIERGASTALAGAAGITPMARQGGSPGDLLATSREVDTNRSKQRLSSGPRFFIEGDRAGHQDEDPPPADDDQDPPLADDDDVPIAMPVGEEEEERGLSDEFTVETRSSPGQRPWQHPGQHPGQRPGSSYRSQSLGGDESSQALNHAEAASSLARRRSVSDGAQPQALFLSPNRSGSPHGSAAGGHRSGLPPPQYQQQQQQRRRQQQQHQPYYQQHLLQQQQHQPYYQQHLLQQQQQQQKQQQQQQWLQPQRQQQMQQNQIEHPHHHVHQQYQQQEHHSRASSAGGAFVRPQRTLSPSAVTPLTLSAN